MKTSEFYLFSKTKRFYPGLCVGDNALIEINQRKKNNIFYEPLETANQPRAQTFTSATQRKFQSALCRFTVNTFTRIVWIALSATTNQAEINFQSPNKMCLNEEYKYMHIYLAVCLQLPISSH